MLKSKNRRGKTRCSGLLAINLPQLVLLIFHIVNKNFLMSSHVLDNEIVIRWVWQVSPRVITVGGSRSGLGSRLTVGLVLTSTIALVEHLRVAICRSRTTLAHESSSRLWVDSTSFVEEDLIVARCVRVSDG